MMNPPPADASERIDPPSETAMRPGLDIDWRAVKLANRACCCPSRPAVIAIVPPSPTRPHSTELLLCGHHYRRSRDALAAAGATVLDPGATPVAPREEWVGVPA
jgi:hypothetical protein